MAVRVEVIPFIVAGLVFGLLVAVVCRLFGARRSRANMGALLLTAILTGYFLYFFRDPQRTPPRDPDIVVSGADGRIAAVTALDQETFVRLALGAGLKLEDLEAFRDGDVTRISIFLSLFSVHVNRAPIAGASRFLGYFPGKHYFTFQEKSSDYNQHNSILIRNSRTACLVNQIVGPVCRRVVYWPDPDQAVDLRIGDRIGMMKFGSRLDMYLPAATVTVLCKAGERVRAGETVVARLRDRGKE